MFGKKKKDEKVSKTECVMTTTKTSSLLQESKMQASSSVFSSEFRTYGTGGLGSSNMLTSGILGGRSSLRDPSKPSIGPQNSIRQSREEFFKTPSFVTDATPFHSRSGTFPLIRNPPLNQRPPIFTTPPNEYRKHSLPTTQQPSTSISVSNSVVHNISDLQSKLKIKVTKSTKFYDDDSHIPTYKTQSKTRGKVLMINNVFNGDKKYRAGSEVDESNMYELFKQMGFKIEKHRNKKKEEMENIINKYRGDKSLASCDISVVIIMSHGGDNKGSSSTVIETIDNKQVPINWIVQQFDRDGCKHLVNKPKIFIFQCCRGNNEQLQTDTVPFSGPRKEADVLLAYSTIPGYVSYRDPKLGTLYIQTICKVFMEHAHNTDVESLLKIVDNKLETYHATGSSQTSSYENRGFKRCYFHPK